MPSQLSAPAVRESYVWGLISDWPRTRTLEYDAD